MPLRHRQVQMRRTDMTLMIPYLTHLQHASVPKKAVL